MVHSDTFRRMWSTTYRGAIECGNMFITKITIIDYTIQRKLVGIQLLFYNFQHSLFEHTCVFANFKRHDLQFKLYFCISIYTVDVICLGCCYGGYFPVSLPQYQFIFKINYQFQPDILFEVSIILKDMYIISPFDRFVLFFIRNLQLILKHDCRRFKL